MVQFLFRRLFLFFFLMVSVFQVVLAAPSTISIAVLQMPNYNGANDGTQVQTNLHNMRAAVSDLIIKWKAQYGQASVPDLILLPELIAAGYGVYEPSPTTPPTILTRPSVWYASEPATYPTTPTATDCILKSGKIKEEIHTVEALRDLALTYHVAFATTFLEKSTQQGEPVDFYNTFVFMRGDGIEFTFPNPAPSKPDIRMRKENSAGSEAYYIKSATGLPHAFTVPYGTGTINIGMGICYENYHCELADYLNKWRGPDGQGIHLLLAPHSAPLDIDFAEVGKAYVEKLNVPVVALANKTGTSLNFYGKSAIVYRSASSSVSVLGGATSNNGVVNSVVNGVSVSYVFGHDLPVYGSAGGNFSMAVDCPGVPASEPATNTNFHFWKSLVANTLTIHAVNNNGVPITLIPPLTLDNVSNVEAYAKTVEATGLVYYSSANLDKTPKYWRTLNCTNP